MLRHEKLPQTHHFKDFNFFAEAVLSKLTVETATTLEIVKFFGNLNTHESLILNTVVHVH